MWSIVECETESSVVQSAMWRRLQVGVEDQIRIMAEAFKGAE